MDWEMPELQPLTIEVDFVQGGALVYSTTTWAGYVGVLTGVRAGGFSVSVNYRRTLYGEENGVLAVLKNLKRGALGHWPVSFLVREVMETESSFVGAVAALQQSELMAPVYLTLAGTQSGEGLVLTRDREGAPAGDSSSCVSERLGHDGCTSVVQTNMDIIKCDQDDPDDDWQDICDSRRRRRFAKAALASAGSAIAIPITMEDLWCLVSLAPCKAHDTVYTTAMVPHTGSLVTRVRVTRAQQQAGRKRWANVQAGQGRRRARAGRATRQ